MKQKLAAADAYGLRAELRKYSPDQERDDHGRFAGGQADPSSGNVYLTPKPGEAPKDFNSRMTAAANANPGLIAVNTHTSSLPGTGSTVDGKTYATGREVAAHQSGKEVGATIKELFNRGLYDSAKYMHESHMANITSMMDNVPVRTAYMNGYNSEAGPTRSKP